MSRTTENEIFNLFAKELYIQGHLDEKDLDDKSKIKEIVLSSIDKTGGVYLVTDHRDSLLQKAEMFLKTNDLELAIVLYAMFFEHAINGVIVRTLEKKKIINKTKNEILRSASLKAKLTWVLELLNLPKFNEKHAKFILNIAEERNAFVHYKFNAYHADKNIEEPLQTLLNDVKKSIRYIKNYDTKVIYKGKKSIVKKRVKNAK
jgi:hypothetical protein